MKKWYFTGMAAIIGMAALFVSACSTEAALQGLFGTGAVSPVFYGVKTPAEGEVEFLFSGEVKVSSLYFDPPLETEVVSQGEKVAVRFRSTLPGGTKIAADILVEDKHKNTLNVMVSFRTRNDRMPELLINEVRAAYSKPKAEFVEIVTLKAGNLGGMCLFAAYESEEPIFEFPPVEVKKGEYIVVHTRSIEEGLVDETGTNLAQSRGTDASPTARDFWVPGTQILHSTNAIYLTDQDGKILNGVTLFGQKSKWTERVAAAAQLMAEQKAWKGANPEDAANSDGNTATRTICRAAGTNTNSAANWYITATSGATPGGANNPKRYQ
ncbi:MAG: hypothetical protein LBB72_08260 [Spirochaetaceae bacterium]|jgi:hypothetical protein|nr:hypothetical protein [Spirochaetaceae bacterium]